MDLAEQTQAPIAFREGMVRMTKEGENPVFTFPCHVPRWEDLGWTTYIPDLLAASGRMEGLPDEIGADGISTMTPLGLTPSNDPFDSSPLDPISASLDTPPAPPDPARGPGPQGSVAPGSLTPPSGAGFAGMTKAQIIAQVLETYGVNLDAGMSKAALVEEAQRLAGLAVLSTPRVADPMPSPTVPSVTEPSRTEASMPDPEPPAAEPIEPAIAEEVPSVPADLLI